MYLPDDNHVMRHAPYKKLLKDEDGNAIGGFFPEAFELRENENGLSVNWLEYFAGTHQENIEASVRKFREIRSIGKTSAFGISSVDDIQKISSEYGANKVRVVLEEEDDNMSHSVIIRLPRDNIGLRQALAVSAFVGCVFDSDIDR